MSIAEGIGVFKNPNKLGDEFGFDICENQRNLRIIFSVYSVINKIGLPVVSMITQPPRWDYLREC
ncbi:MAG: hypothetical protein LBC02_14370 [Planctomycetaceae bacterium]|nr:hypothetical protein [Planctomycetaceae bacterium]